VSDILYVPGLFYDARTEESALVNECNLVTLRLGDGRSVGVRQVAGKVARRIVCRLERGQRVAAGEKFGMIRFGSTAELILGDPDGVEVLVKVGDRVRGGTTVLTRPARTPPPAARTGPAAPRNVPRV
jgi:phosphatidylserine decarboxylase